MDMVGKSNYTQSFANGMQLFNGKSNTAKKHNHDAPYHHLHTLDPYMRSLNQQTSDLKNQRDNVMRLQEQPKGLNAQEIKAVRPLLTSIL